MIEKMKFLSITGPKADIDRMTETYLSRYEIHLENALAELTEVANLSPFLEDDELLLLFVPPDVDLFCCRFFSVILLPL